MSDAPMICSRYFQPPIDVTSHWEGRKYVRNKKICSLLKAV